MDINVFWSCASFQNILSLMAGDGDGDSNDNLDVVDDDDDDDVDYDGGTFLFSVIQNINS